MQRLEHHLTINGVELINGCRTTDYIRGVTPGQPQPDPGWVGIDDCCDDSPGVYASPTDDAAPWYDSGILASAEFFGFLPSSMTLSTPYGRAGGTDFSVGQQRITKRQLLIEGHLIAGTPRGTDFGREWMMQTLLNPCSPINPCIGSRLGLKRHRLCEAQLANALTADPMKDWARDSFAGRTNLGRTEIGDYKWSGTGSVSNNRLSLGVGEYGSLATFDHEDIAVSWRHAGGERPAVSIRNGEVTFSFTAVQIQILDKDSVLLDNGAYTISVGDRLEVLARGDSYRVRVNNVEIATVGYDGAVPAVPSPGNGITFGSASYAADYDDLAISEVVPEFSEAKRDLFDAFLVSFEDITPDDFPKCQGAELAITIEAEASWLYDQVVDSCWSKAQWDLTTSWCPPFSITVREDEAPETRNVQVQAKKERRPIEVRRDGTWCPIGWTAAPDHTRFYYVPTFVDFPGVEYIEEEDDEFHYVRLVYNSETDAFVWSPLNFSGTYLPCDKPVRVRQVSYLNPVVPEGDPAPDPPVWVVDNIGSGVFNRNVQLNIDGTATAKGWDPADNWPIDSATYRITNQCNEPEFPDESACGQGPCKIQIRDDYKWTALNWVHDPLAKFPPEVEKTGCTSLEVGQNDDPITVTVQVEVDPCAAVPPEMAPFAAPAPPRPSSTNPYCEPLSYSPLVCITTPGSGAYERILDVEVYSGHSEMRNISITAWELDDSYPDPDTDQNDLEWYLTQSPVWFRNVGYVPRDSFWRFAGRRNRAQVICSHGIIRSGDSSAFDPSNRSQSPLQCGSQYVVLAAADADNTSDRAWVSAVAVRRELT